MTSRTGPGMHSPSLPLKKFFTFNFYQNIVALQSCVKFLTYSKVNQLYVYIHSLFFGFASHLGHHRALSRVP